MRTQVESYVGIEFHGGPLPGDLEWPSRHESIDNPGKVRLRTFDRTMSQAHVQCLVGQVMLYPKG